MSTQKIILGRLINVASDKFNTIQDALRIFNKDAILARVRQQRCSSLLLDFGPTSDDRIILVETTSKHVNHVSLANTKAYE